MRLTFGSPYLSILEFEDIELPDLTVIYGLNGSGKTHLLEAIGGSHNIITYDKNIMLSCVNVADASRFDLLSFYPKRPQEIHEAQVEFLRKTLIETARLDGFVEKFTDNEQRWAIHNAEMLAFYVAAQTNPVELRKFDFYVIDRMFDSNHGTAQKIKDCRDNTGVFLFEIEPDDLAINLDRNQNHFLDPKIGDFFGLYYALWQRHKKRQKRAERERYYTQSDSDFEARYGPKPWIEFNELLDKSGIGVSIVNPPGDYTQPWSPGLQKDGMKMELAQLSAGEQVVVNLTMANLARQSGAFDPIMPGVLLLDEPDAHLHPARVRQLLREFVEPLVESGTRVIWTTHSPVTVALAPGDSFFEKISGKGLRRTTKQQALDSLMTGVPHLALDPTGRRQVFTEATIDAQLYEVLYDRLRSQLESDRSLTFIGVGDSHDGGKDRVRQIVSQLREKGNNSVFGIIDWDLKEESSDYIYVSSADVFYSIENMLLNPLLLGLMLIRDGRFKPLAKYTYGDVIRNPEPPLQDIIDVMQAELTAKMKVTAGSAGQDASNVEVALVGGWRAVMSSVFVHENGHNYEKHHIDKFDFDRYLNAIPELNLIKNIATKKSLAWASAERVLRDSPDFIPKAVFDLFKKLLN